MVSLRLQQERVRSIHEEVTIFKIEHRTESIQTGEEVGTLLREMQENDIIEPSASSPWASQSSWFVRKMAPQDFRVDYRKLNDVTRGQLPSSKDR
ncbi:hypothetical protein TNCV_3399571 [Trichonephila clavipes]|nr:hypothetical protein TNCV_3399571 [Trichonephila clavipes]